jgi:hypothetical protein
VPSAGNDSFAGVQRLNHHLWPVDIAGFVLSNGSMFSNRSCRCYARSARCVRATALQEPGSQREIRHATIEAPEARMKAKFE